MNQVHQSIFWYIVVTPFKKHGYDYHKKNLRTVNEYLLRYNANLHVGDKLCDGCHKATLKLPVILTQQEGWFSDSSKSQDDLNVPEVPLTSEKIEAIEALNKSLTAIEETPIKRKHYPETKIKKVMEAFRTKILNLSSSTSQPDTVKNHNNEIINQLKEKFNDTIDKSVRMQILTMLPKSWTLKKIEFRVSNFTARKAKKKKKLNENGVMSCPNPKSWRTLDPAIPDIDKKFYLKMEHYPDKRIGFSKFCELRPKYCALLRSSGMHSVCVCTIHQNAKLMMAQCKIPELTNGELPIKTYKDVTSSIICKTPTSKCYFTSCVNCPGNDDLKARFEEAFELNSIEHASFKQWMQTDNKRVLETIIKSTEEFLDHLFQS
ncbi:hypothetical protein AVEN_170533-1 [Araneus ventricosus]|uniref:Uncharacterized protein n=1 Tax=Araneus ventricosus TaxID=182803 RepID=A0A4Y2BYX2_ARAVE|nr:hypothetical protein AVEN_170533-1 [Araneus ventricosus]